MVRLVLFCILAILATTVDAKTMSKESVQLTYRPIIKPSDLQFAAMEVSLT
ncbi:MAG: hypothetical protein RL481_1465, partial [Pseudomonadota bacterium]